ncbi:hypothetical protein [Allorhodopirellula heiligendammensis]|uniref:Uncharacterized protein n=1 Tax=Allorhodopirellula heiligendammensis TaxID=2714739 RepID=A0A5C6BFX1_9BACT|nr:hypothetical protein [Allorhodopirellula heiligendammensis]TWU10958.1 hypothetical protein Poly21_48640 [Allorhodopirellula heiligendammensis]|tara:strand:+ start:416 stop:592 length:177 start_codon:yes stop_codon:yes gene_type:complete
MRDTFRSVGAIIGLVLGLALMWMLGWGGMVPAAIFGAGGAVIGGMSGERIADRGGRTK